MINFVKLHAYAVELLNQGAPEGHTHKPYKVGFDNHEFKEFSFVKERAFDNHDGVFITVTIKHRNGFKFVLRLNHKDPDGFKIDPKDADRIEYVYSIHAMLFDESRGFNEAGVNNPCILSPIAKKVVPSFEKIKKEYLSLTKQRYDFLKENIHDLDETMATIHDIINERA